MVLLLRGINQLFLKTSTLKDTLETFIEFPTFKKPTIFFSVLDVGFNFQPYPHNSRINLGFLFSAQLNQTFESNYIGKITNISKNETVNYDLRINHKYILSTVVLGYSFYKIKKRVIKYNLNPLGS